MPPKHRDPQKSTPICSFWQEGRCTKGVSCRFRHGASDARPPQERKEPPPASINAPCRYYAQSLCSKGERCPFQHSSHAADETHRRKAWEQQQERLRAQSEQKMLRSRPGGAAQLQVGRAEVTVEGTPAAAAGAGAGAHASEEEEVAWYLGERSYSYGAPGAGEESKEGRDSQGAWAEVAVKGIPDELLEAAQAEEADVKEQPKEERVCRYFLAGNCRYGLSCRDVHLAGEGGSAEEEAEAMRKELAESESAQCGVCYERIKEVSSQFGLLTGCNHTYCLGCIRSWRDSSHEGREAPNSKATVQKCPICRVPSHFVVPSPVIVVDPDRKARVIEQYKAKLRKIPCKYFEDGKRRCPFGVSCFYAHLKADGVTPASPPKVRYRSKRSGSCEAFDAFVVHIFESLEDLDEEEAYGLLYDSGDSDY
ncbi:unnamed protein product [Chrysoparadoxa australica]